jgi:hypothetical protein
MKRFVGLSLVALALGLASAPASARDGENAAAAALGIVGGLAIGAAIASQPPAHVVVRRPAPVVVEEIEEEPVCVIKRRRYVDEFGDVTVRRTKVCD